MLRAPSHPIGTAQVQRDAIPVLREPGQFAAERRRDGVEPGQPVAQQRFEFGLVEEIVVGPAERLRPARGAHIADDAVIRAQVQVPLRLAHRRRDRLGKSGRLEQPHHLMVEMHCARQGMGRRLAIDHQDAQTGRSGQVGCQRADRTATDHRHVVRHGHRPAAIRGRQTSKTIDRAPLAAPNWRPGAVLRPDDPCCKIPCFGIGIGLNYGSGAQIAATNCTPRSDRR
jgi:hypothetical protein